MKDKKFSKTLEPLFYLIIITLNVQDNVKRVVNGEFNPSPARAWCAKSTYPYDCEKEEDCIRGGSLLKREKMPLSSLCSIVWFIIAIVSLSMTVAHVYWTERAQRPKQVNTSSFPIHTTTKKSLSGAESALEAYPIDDDRYSASDIPRRSEEISDDTSFPIPTTTEVLSGAAIALEAKSVGDGRADSASDILSCVAERSFIEKIGSTKARESVYGDPSVLFKNVAIMSECDNGKPSQSQNFSVTKKYRQAGSCVRNSFPCHVSTRSLNDQV